MKLKFCFLLIVGLILTSCSSSAQKPNFTYDSNETTTIDTASDIHIDSIVGTETDIQVDSTTDTEIEIYTDTSSAETSEQAVNNTDDNTRSESNVQSIVSPNGEYVLIPTSVTYDNSQNIVYNSLCLTKVDDNTEIASLDETFYDISVEWSPDSNYAAVKEIDKNRQYSDTIMVFDISNGTVLSMPRLEIQNKIQAEVSDTVNLYSCDLLSCEWADNHTLKVDFDMKTGVSFYSKSHLGYYTFDLESDSITTLEYDDIAANTPDIINLTEDEIKTIVDENLDILMSDSDGFYSEKEFIDAHPDAFENIIALGDAALPYLKEIGDKYIYEMTSDSRCYMATAAAYVINPMMYDIISISPDGNYILKASVSTFFWMWNSEIGIEYDFLSVVEAETGNILTSTGKQLGALCNIDSIYWSPDNLYAVVLEGHAKYLHDVIILDIPDKSIYRIADDLYIINAINEIYGNSFSLGAYHEDFQEWFSDDQVKISFSMKVCNDFITGWYLYDLNRYEIIYYEYEISA